MALMKETRRRRSDITQKWVDIQICHNHLLGGAPHAGQNRP